MVSLHYVLTLFFFTVLLSWPVPLSCAAQATGGINMPSRLRPRGRPEETRFPHLMHPQATSSSTARFVRPLDELYHLVWGCSIPGGKFLRGNDRRFVSPVAPVAPVQGECP